MAKSSGHSDEEFTVLLAHHDPAANKTFGIWILVQVTTCVRIRSSLPNSKMRPMHL